MMLPDPTEVMPTRNPPISPMSTHAGKRLHGGRALDEMIFNPSLKQEQRGNQTSSSPTADLMKSLTPAP